MKLQHSFLVCALWLLACYPATSPKKYRIMWVSTTGKDSPQCMHDGVASGPVPYPRHRNEVCRSLNYALTHIQSDSLVIVTCGIHVLEPVGSPSDHTLLSNIASIRIQGSRNCTPRIQCTNGANLAFYNVETVGIARLVFLDCGELLQHSNSFFISSTLHFQESMSVTIDHVIIQVTGPYGVGISFIRRNNTATQGKILLETVLVEHHGFHGSGIHFDVVTSQKANISQTGENLKLDHVHIISRHVHPSHGLSRKFTGINITVRGDGEGGEISLSDILITVCPNRTTRGNGISLVLLDRVHGYRVSFRNVSFYEECETHHNSSNMTVDGITVDTTHDSTSAIYSNIVNIELGGNSMGNHILITAFSVLNYGVTPAISNTLSIVVKDQSQDNVILLQQLRLLRSDNSSTHRRGLQVIVTGWAMRNEVHVMGLHSWGHKAVWGAGGYVEFSGHAQGNLVNLINSTFRYNHAVRGGGIAVVCRDFATQNAFNICDLHILDNFAGLGGGVYVLLKDSSHNNSVYLTDMYLADNTAHCGGGMFVQIQDTSVASRVETLNSLVLNNTLLPSEIHAMMGGGAHVEFSTVGATFKTDNSVSFTGCMAIYNTAMQGVGGGISVLYKHSHYEGESGDSVTPDTVLLFQNKAVSGSACAFQSLPTHGKRLFKGVQLMDTQAFLSTTAFQAMDKDELLEMVFHVDVESYLVGIVKQALNVIQQQLEQTIVPSFQMDTNTNLILVNSVRVTVGHLFFFCGASSQGMYALDSEIVLQANTLSMLTHCVATHGGAIALYGESYIRVGKNTTLLFAKNHAFQRGGAIYANSAPGVVPVSNCFLQIDQLQDGEENRGAIIFRGNSAKAEGQSVYVSEIRNCFSGNTLKNITTNFALHYPKVNDISISLVSQVIFTFAYCTLSTHVFLSPQCLNVTSKEYGQMLMQQEIASGPNYVGGATVDLSKPPTISFIPGKQKRLPYTHVYDEFGSNISSVFTVLINKMDDSVPVELDPFSKYTADFTVILHGIPQRHGMANYSFPGNTTDTSAVGTPPQRHGMTTNNSFFSNTTNTSASSAGFAVSGQQKSALSNEHKHSVLSSWLCLPIWLRRHGNMSLWDD